MEARCAAFSPDGTRVVTGCFSGRVVVWSLVDDTEPDRHLSLQSHQSWVAHVEFAPDGERVLVAKGNDPALILTLADGSFQHLGYESTMATFVSADRILIACGDGRAVLVTDTGELVREYPGHEAALRWAAMSPSGELVVTASRDGTARLWRAADATLVAEYRGNRGMVCSVEFSPSEERILTGYGDGTAGTWLVDGTTLLALAVERTGRDFSPEEFVRYEELLRVPAREAREPAKGLRDELVLKERIVARLRDDGDLDAVLRETALRMAEGFVDSPWHLHQTAWSIVQHPDRTREEYAGGLRRAAAACELWPEAKWMIRTHGAALYRAGRLEGARETLRRAEEMHEPRFGDRRYILLFLVMAEYELGEAAEAERLLERARGLSTSDDPEEVIRPLREAEEFTVADLCPDRVVGDRVAQLADRRAGLHAHAVGPVVREQAAPFPRGVLDLDRRQLPHPGHPALRRALLEKYPSVAADE